MMRFDKVKTLTLLSAWLQHLGGSEQQMRVKRGLYVNSKCDF